MDEDSIIQLIILSILLLLSAFFSGSETAFFSLTGLERDSLRKKSSSYLLRILESLFSTQNQMLITILTGNMLVNIFTASIGESLGRDIFSGKSELFSIIIITLILLLVGEMTPKNIAIRHSRGFVRLSAPALFYLHRFLTPLRLLLNGVTYVLLRLFPSKFEDIPDRKEATILNVVHFGINQQKIDRSEYHLFKSYFSFKEKSAVDIMIPRNNIEGISSSIETEEVLRGIENNKVLRIGSYIMVYQEDIDHPDGFLEIKDLLKVKFLSSSIPPLKSLIRSFHIVPHTKDLTELMTEMRETGTEVALLVDEYGGTAGIITFQILIEELLRFFYPGREGKITETGEGWYSVPGSLPIEILEELFNIDIETESHTIAGIVLEALGEIPSPGTELTFSGLKIKINKASNRKIIELDVGEDK